MLRARSVPFIVVLPNHPDGFVTLATHLAAPTLLRCSDNFCQLCISLHSFVKAVMSHLGQVPFLLLLCFESSLLLCVLLFMLALYRPCVQAAKTMAGVEVSAWGAVQNWRTWYLAVINLCDSTVKYAIIYWCPLIIYHMVGENMPHTAGEAVVPHDALVALLTALPFGFAALFMLVNARHSAATGQRYYCTARPPGKLLHRSCCTGCCCRFCKTSSPRLLHQVICHLWYGPACS